MHIEFQLRFRWNHHMNEVNQKLIQHEKGAQKFFFSKKQPSISFDTLASFHLMKKTGNLNHIRIDCTKD